MEPSSLVEPVSGGPAERLASRSRTGKPLVSGAAVASAGYAILTSVLLGLGLLLTQTEIGDPIGRNDAIVNRWFFEARTPTLDGLTEWGSRLGDTATVIGIAFAAVIILAIARRLAEIAFLVTALLIEVASFLTTTFFIDRNRPEVPQMDVSPPTSSFPSGHAAAAIVLYVGLALITSSLVRSTFVRALVWILAVALPLAVANSRLYRGMHHPSDVVGSMIGAAAALSFALLATRTGVAVSERGTRDAEPSTDVPPSPRDTPDMEVVR